MLPPIAGTYILFMQMHKPKSIQVGKLGEFMFRPGYYCYIGSAFGPGGLRARVNRHILKNKKKKWHIDYIREEVSLFKIWYSIKPIKLECSTVKHFNKIGCIFPVKGFGSSDCKCLSHLVQLKSLPDLSQFKNYQSIDYSG